MKKITLLITLLIFNNVLSQDYIEQVLILNEGYYDYYDTQEIIEPVTIGSYDIDSNDYTEIATIEGARFASDLIIDGNNFYVAADNKILKYDLDSYELLEELEVLAWVTWVLVDDPRICHVIKTTIVIGSTQRAIIFHFLSITFKTFVRF